MAIGQKLRKLLRLPGLHIAVKNDGCISCNKCDKACPMSVDVSKSVKLGENLSEECVQCGACVDSCPQNILAYKIGKRY